MKRHATRLLLLAAALVSAHAFVTASAADPVEEVPLGESVERHLSAQMPLQVWSQDPDVLGTLSGDRIEERPVVIDDVETVKLTGLVPPIRFASGVAQIPPDTIRTLRARLEEMRHLDNVRLHVVGHADDQPLSDALARVYGDNRGLSRERAGEVAELIQRALSLPPDAIAFEWAGASRPVASNASETGRAKNRRVEVEIWYDIPRPRAASEAVVVSEATSRIKVCRVETVCQLRYREGNERRTRIRNLVPPLRIDDETVGVPDRFVQEIAQALENLSNQRNVTVRFVGFTDDVPLEGRAARIYGTHLALSKARAHRVAMATREALGLASGSVSSDGHGAARPLASNETAQGRTLNRRVEVELWHDDPLQVLPEDPQPCPDPADAEWVTRVYDPAWGRLPTLLVEDGGVEIADAELADLRRALADVAERERVRLRFVGYTGNETLDRRTAMAYGDDVGLSVARARRAMDTVLARLGDPDAPAEYEGRGFVHSDDVVNAGFFQGEASQVAVQVVYDERAVVDDWDGVDITPLTRELAPQDPLALNLMRITVDGEPIDDPGRSSADIQRCTDVALERADIQFGFDALSSERSLRIAAVPDRVALPGATVRFRTATNYAPFIARAEVRLFSSERSVRGQPLAVVAVGDDGDASWSPDDVAVPTGGRELAYVLRTYDAEGRFDETVAQRLWLYARTAEAGGTETVAPPASLAAAGEAAGEAPEAPNPPALAPKEAPLALANIPLEGTGTVKVQGAGVPEGHSVWLAGERVPVDASGRFAADAILPTGAHTVEVAVLDEQGSGELYLRDLEIDREDWFYVGIADLTLSMTDESDAAAAFEGDNAAVDFDSFADGRIAFFVTGRFGEDWRLTASADTREGPIDELFSNFLDKSPDALFRRLEPDAYYPTFGDDGVVQEMAPTQGKLFVELERRASHLRWGNFQVGYRENELALVERGLYGANLRYASDATTSFGERRLVLDGFAAEPGTVSSREEFRGTGGSLYFLRNQDLLTGSERLRIEIRDKDSGLVSSVVHLQPDVDYDIDPIQGRVLLAEPLASTATDSLLVRSGGSPGDEAWLVVQYEYTPGLGDLDAIAAGGDAHYWFGDHVRLGLTANQTDESGTDGNLQGADVTARWTTDSWVKLQAGRTDGAASFALRSDDGGFGFGATTPPGFLPTPEPSDATGYRTAYRLDVSLGAADLFEGADGRLNLYLQQREAGYAAPGLSTLADTQQFGGQLRVPLTEALDFAAKADHHVEDGGLERQSQEIDLGYRFDDRWQLHTGVRRELREDASPFVPVTQVQGERTDAVVQLGYDSKARWSGYGFAQATVATSGNSEDNGRLGIGGVYRVNDRLSLDGEVSHGQLGPGARLGTRYRHSERSDVYVNYALDNERREDGLLIRRGSLVAGAKSRFSDSTSVYVEERYQQQGGVSGQTHTGGIELTPDGPWTFGANIDVGTLVDRQTGAETRRKAGSSRVDYFFESLQLASQVEYRTDETQALDGTWSDRTTWLFRGNLNYQVTPSWRFISQFARSESESSLGAAWDGGYTETVVGSAFRPVDHDRVNVLAKYTYFENLPTLDTFGVAGGATRFLQKSHIASVDVDYELAEDWTVGAKYAYRLGQLSLDRESPEFFDNNAHLLVARIDWRFREHWEVSAEARLLELSDLGETRSGAVVSVYRDVGEHVKVGVGYNFTDFSADLTDLRYDRQGVFLNVVGSL